MMPERLAWYSCAASLGILIAYEHNHSRYAFPWSGVILANVLLVMAVTPWVLRHRVVSLRQLFLFQLIGALEALTIQWTGSLGVAGAFVLVGLVVVCAKCHETAR